jgi:phage/plasmid-like protein (TIGR03299 family)
MQTITTVQGTHADTPEARAVSNMRAGLHKQVTSGYSRDRHLLLTAPRQVALAAGGTPVGPDAPPSQAFAAAGADFVVESRPIAFDHSPEADNFDWRSVSTHKALVRTDTGAALGVVGRGYQPIQNQSLIDLFSFLHEDAQLDNIVVLGGGRRVYATATIAIEGEVIPGDPIRRHLHAFNSFDGSTAFGVFFSDLRLVCANQLAYISGKGARKARSRSEGLVMRHTTSAEAFARQLPQLIDLQTRTFRQSLDELKPLTTTRLSTEAARAVLEATYSDKLAVPIKDKDTGKPRPRVLADLEDTCLSTIRSHAFGSTGIGIDPSDRSVWNLFQAITQFETHDAGRLKDPVAAARARLESLWGGESAQRIDRAREACLALV